MSSFLYKKWFEYYFELPLKLIFVLTLEAMVSLEIREENEDMGSRITFPGDNNRPEVNVKHLQEYPQLFVQSTGNIFRDPSQNPILRKDVRLPSAPRWQITNCERGGYNVCFVLFVAFRSLIKAVRSYWIKRLRQRVREHDILLNSAAACAAVAGANRSFTKHDRLEYNPDFLYSNHSDIRMYREKEWSTFATVDQKVTHSIFFLPCWYCGSRFWKILYL